MSPTRRYYDVSIRRGSTIHCNPAKTKCKDVKQSTVAAARQLAGFAVWRVCELTHELGFCPPVLIIKTYIYYIFCFFHCADAQLKIIREWPRTLISVITDEDGLCAPFTVRLLRNIFQYHQKCIALNRILRSSTAYISVLGVYVYTFPPEC